MKILATIIVIGALLVCLVPLNADLVNYNNGLNSGIIVATNTAITQIPFKISAPSSQTNWLALFNAGQTNFATVDSLGRFGIGSPTTNLFGAMDIGISHVAATDGNRKAWINIGMVDTWPTFNYGGEWWANTGTNDSVMDLSHKDNSGVWRDFVWNNGMNDAAFYMQTKKNSAMTFQLNGGTGTIQLGGQTNLISDNGSAITFNGTALGGGSTNMMVSSLAPNATIAPTFAISGLSTTAASCRRLTIRIPLTNNVTTVSAPAGTLVDGDTMVWEVLQDAIGSRTITGWDSVYAFGTDITGITLTTTASKRDFITFVYNSTADKWFCAGFVRGY